MSLSSSLCLERERADRQKQTSGTESGTSRFTGEQIIDTDKNTIFSILKESLCELALRTQCPAAGY